MTRLALTLCLGLLTATSATAQNPACPLTSDGLIPQDRTFADSAGNTANYQILLPVGYDPLVPGPVAIYFHGNNGDDGGSFEPSVSSLLFEASIDDMPLVAIESIHSRTNMDGSVVKAWQDDDPLLLRELLASSFDGCIAFDPQQVYLVSGSEGTCYLAEVLTQWLGYEYGGGFVGLCGCWQWGDRDWEVQLQPLRSHWKIFIENTTEDFLYERGLIGLDDFGHNLGLDVRTDLMRPGLHCIDAFPNVPAVLDWMRGGADYPREYPDLPHWQQVELRVSSAVAIAYDAMRTRFLLAVNRPDLTDAERQEINDYRIPTSHWPPEDFEMWLADNYPQFASPTLFVLATDDYGDSFSVLGKRSEVVSELLVRSDGSVLLATTTGLLQSSDGGSTFAPLAFDGMDVQALVQDDQGRLFAIVLGLGPLQRSLDGGMTWQELSVATGLLFANSENELRVQGGRLMAYGGDGVVHFSDDGGDTFDDVTLPSTDPRDIAHHGDWVYAVIDAARVIASSDRGQSFHDLTTLGDIGHTLDVTPDGVLWVNEFANLQWRSSDNGESFEREPGLHNVRDMDIAYGAGAQRMVVAARGIFRHSAAVPPGTWPPVTGSSAAGAGGTSATAGSSGMQATAGAGGAAAGASGASSGGAPASISGSAAPGPLAGAPVVTGMPTEEESGCGCRAPRARSNAGGTLCMLGLLLTLVLRRRAR